MFSYIEKPSLAQITNLLFFLFPISFILGSLIVTLNLYLFLILGFFYIKKSNYKLNFDYINNILIFFFLLIIISSLINLQSIKFDYFIRSILLLRFVFLYMLMETLLVNKDINFKKFFVVSLVCTSFVSLDIIFQYIFGYNFFGQTEVGGKLTGVFGDEAVAGGYIQKFSLISIFGALIFFNEKKYKKFTLCFIILLHLMGVFFANNKISFITLFFSLIVLSLIDKETRYIIISSIIIFLSIAFLLLTSEKNIFNGDDKLKDRYQYTFIKFFLISDGEKNDSVIPTIKERLNETEKKTIKEGQKISKFGKIGKLNIAALNHTRIYITAIESWKKSPLIGRGYKSFRTKCFEILEETKGKRKFGLRCATHPHNYQLEILHDFGLVGLFVIFIFSIIKIYLIFKKFMSKTIKNRIYSIYFVPIVLGLLIEFWPIKSTGSLFTTWNGTATWLLIALSVIIKKDITFDNLNYTKNNTNIFASIFALILVSTLIIKNVFLA
jgi:O-antigen ligase